jgi:hypothetical protein
MPSFVDRRLQASMLKDKYFLLNQHLLECYEIISKNYEKSNKTETYNISAMLRNHKALITRLQFVGKKKPKSLLILQNFANTREKSIGFAILTSTLNNRKLFSM